MGLGQGVEVAEPRFTGLLLMCIIIPRLEARVGRWENRRLVQETRCKERGHKETIAVGEMGWDSRGSVEAEAEAVGRISADLLRWEATGSMGEGVGERVGQFFPGLLQVMVAMEEQASSCCFTVR